MEAEVETVISDLTNIEVGKRVYVLVNVPLPVIQDFDQIFPMMAAQQNDVEGFVEKFGKCSVEVLPLEAHRRVQTLAEAKEKKRKRNREHNQKESVKKKRKEQQQSEETKRKRREYNQLESTKIRKEISGKKGKRALRVLKELHPNIHEEVTSRGVDLVRKELEAKRKLYETCDRADNEQLEQDIADLEDELGIELMSNHGVCLMDEDTEEVTIN